MQKTKEFYHSCLDARSIEAAGAEPFLTLIQKVWWWLYKKFFGWSLPKQATECSLSATLWVVLLAPLFLLLKIQITTRENTSVENCFLKHISSIFNGCKWSNVKTFGFSSFYETSNRLIILEIPPWNLGDYACTGNLLLLLTFFVQAKKYLELSSFSKHCSLSTSTGLQRSHILEIYTVSRRCAC